MCVFQQKNTVHIKPQVSVRCHLLYHCVFNDHRLFFQIHFLGQAPFLVSFLHLKQDSYCHITELKYPFHCGKMISPCLYVRDL